MFAKAYAIIGGVVLLTYAYVGFFGVEFGKAKLSSSVPPLYSSGSRSGGGGWFGGGGGGGFGGGK